MKKLLSVLAIFCLCLATGPGAAFAETLTVTADPPKSGENSTNAAVQARSASCQVYSDNPHRSGTLARAHGRINSCTSTASAVARMTLEGGGRYRSRNEGGNVRSPSEQWKSEISLTCNPDTTQRYFFTTDWTVSFPGIGTGYGTTGANALVYCRPT